jgi:predicted RNA-binding protein Jag
LKPLLPTRYGKNQHYWQRHGIVDRTQRRNTKFFTVHRRINDQSQTGERIRLILDVEDYRKKRDESLESLAVRLSEKVKATQKNVVMRPMSSQERRIVHTALQEDPQVVTYSMGDEPNRKVVIALKK